MNVEVIMLSKISQLQSDKRCVILLIWCALEVVKIIETVESHSACHFVTGLFYLA